MRVCIVTDAWSPQVNGVVRTLEATRHALTAMGHQVLVIGPDSFSSVPCPTYGEIRLALTTRAAVGRRIAAFGPHAIHLATEGPLCLAARSWCLALKAKFTTAYHTQFPDYVAARTGLNPEWVWRYIRWFHAPAEAVLASTPSIADTLHAHGVMQVRPMGAGGRSGHLRERRARSADPRPPGAGIAVCRAGGGGEEHRGVPVVLARGIEGGGRGWAGARRSGGAFPRGAFPGA